MIFTKNINFIKQKNMFKPLITTNRFAQRYFSGPETPYYLQLLEKIKKDGITMHFEKYKKLKPWQQRIVFNEFGEKNQQLYNNRMTKIAENKTEPIRKAFKIFNEQKLQQNQPPQLKQQKKEHESSTANKNKEDGFTLLLTSLINQNKHYPKTTQYQDLNKLADDIIEWNDNYRDFELIQQILNVKDNLDLLDQKIKLRTAQNTNRNNSSTGINKWEAVVKEIKKSF